MARDSVTVIVPTFNRARFLSQALDSVLGQTVPPEQVIAVNDGSTDDTDAVLASYGSRIHVVKQANAGKSAALNAALSLARGDFIWIFDDDDVALPDAIATHFRVIAQNPNVGFSYSSFLWASNGADDRIVPGPEYQMPDVPTDEVFLRLLEGVFFRLTGCLVRARCYAEVGPFDQAMIRSEDYDMQVRLARRYSSVYTGAPTMYARQHDGPRGDVRDRHSAAERDRKHLAYDRIVTECVMRSLRLSDFLPGAADSPPMTPLQKRHAHLQRQCILMRKGFWSEALDDLREAMTLETSNAPLSAAERRICLASLGEPVVFEDPAATRALFRNIRHACDSCVGLEARVQMARGIFHGLISRSWAPAASFQMLLGLVELVGARGAIPLALRDWRWRTPRHALAEADRYPRSSAIVT